jgi:hypothetical protein
MRFWKGSESKGSGGDAAVLLLLQRAKAVGDRTLAHAMRFR